MLGIEPRAPYMLGKYSINRATSLALIHYFLHCFRPSSTNCANLTNLQKLQQPQTQLSSICHGYLLTPEPITVARETELSGWVRDAGLSEHLVPSTWFICHPVPKIAL